MSELNGVNLVVENDVDCHVGARIRARRVELSMSQTNVADRLGLTFQQVQKYERGYNRVSASRLYDLTEILDVDIAYFFEGFNDTEVLESPEDWTADVWGLIAAFNGLPEKLRMSLRLLLKSIPTNKKAPDVEIRASAEA
jgi:transcriptional regulator with XRE-family HTH domain